MKVKLVATPPLKEQETSIALKSAEPGTMVRFAHHTYDEALQNNLFYVVLQNVNKRIKLVCLETAELIERDEDFRVIWHECEIYVKPNISQTI